MQNLIINSFGSTDVGRQREINEDYFIIDELKHLYIVADGMGGHNAGEEASRVACTTFSSLFTPGEANIREHLIDCVKRVNSTIHEMASADINLEGMGTTLVACYGAENQVHLCHAGDSRAYLFRNRKLEQLTEDHSAVAIMIREGYITREEAEDHPLKNRITKALGTMREIEPDYSFYNLEKNDIMLLCTDGLSNLVKEHEIEEILIQKSSLKEKSLLLIQTANNKGGHDNITAVLIEAT